MVRTIDMKGAGYSELFAKDCGEDLPWASMRDASFRFQPRCFRTRDAVRAWTQRLPEKTKPAGDMLQCVQKEFCRCCCIESTLMVLKAMLL